MLTLLQLIKIYLISGKSNTEFSLNLFQLAIEHQIPVKYASSASVYGMTNDTMNPLNYYAISKLTVDYW